MMKERFEAAGGRMFVDSRLGAGTLIAASIPMDA
jgi:signal transduction histidine kinase